MALTKPPVLPAWAETGDKVQPTNAEIQAGWPLSNMPPARQRWNWILNFVANGIRYLTRRGLPDWGADETYEIGDCTRGPDGLSYKALTQNTNKAPAANPADWVRWAFSANESINQNFAGLVRSLTPTGGALVREWADTVAATTGNIEIGQSYNCAVDPVSGVWAGRDVADICWLEKWSDVGGVKEFWYAPTAAAGAVPVWQKVAALDMVGGGLSLTARASEASQAVRLDQVPYPYRNRIINGDMSVSQVNGGTAVTPTASGYISDQWRAAIGVASKLTFQQVADAPAGFKYSTKITVAAQYAPAAADSFLLQQPIEGQNIIDLGFGTANNRRIALGIQIKGSVAGTYAVNLFNAAVNRSYVGTIAVTNAWSPVVVTLDADSAGAWVTDNTVALWVSIDLGSGANFNTAAGAWQAGNYYRTAGCVTFVNQVNGSTLNITGVQLEKVAAGATVGTEFEFVSYAEQLRRCQRYLPCLNSGGSASILGTGGFVSSTQGWAVIPFTVTPRVPVTGMVMSSAAHLTLGSVTSPVPTSASISGQGVNCCYLSFTVSGATAGHAADLYFNNASGQLYFTGAQM